MGMTGAGKSTFISLCTGEDVPVGHELQACTKEVTIYQCRWSSTVNIYLVDTPGFDDTNRSDTSVLKEIATWLTISYEKNMELSGIIYLHRITDTRMGGSARKNLFMFRKLCGTEVLQNVLLVSTMWEVGELANGERRESELVDTEDFWGILVESGAKVERHDNSRESAMGLLKKFVGKNRVIMSIQKEMVNDHKTLDQTQAGMELEGELQKERDKFKRELAEVQETMKEAIRAQDQKSAELLRRHEADMQQKIDLVIKEREQLKVSMEKMHADKFAEFEKKYETQRAELLEKEERIEKLERLQHSERETKNKATKQTVPTHHAKPAPGTDRLGEPVSLTISGSSYSFIGPRWVYGKPPPGFEIPKTWCESQRRIFGVDYSWYCHRHVDGACNTEWSDNLKVLYPDLGRWLNKSKKRSSGCLAHLSLGNNGYFFVRAMNGDYEYSLPKPITDRVRNMADVERCWLGIGDACVIQEAGNKWWWNLLGNYGLLEERIKEYDSIKDMAMDLQDPQACIIISGGGDCEYRPGRPDHTFNEAKFQTYITRNFGTTW